MSVTQLALIYGKLTVRRSYRDPQQRRMVCECVCACGGTIVARESDLRSGHTVACGCVKRGLDRPRKDRRTYNTWMAMRRRCYDPKFQSYPNYGGRGIRVWPAWNDPETGYVTFVRDMGERPKGMTLDRRNPNMGYMPSNCRWATDLEQAHNKRRLWDRRMAEEDASEQEYWNEQERAAAESASES